MSTKNLCHVVVPLPLFVFIKWPSYHNNVIFLNISIEMRFVNNLYLDNFEKKFELNFQTIGCQYKDALKMAQSRNPLQEFNCPKFKYVYLEY